MNAVFFPQGPASLPHPGPDPALVLGKATARASELLDLSGAALARVIGLSEPSISRLLHGQRGLNPRSKEGELATLLVHNAAQRLAWMNSHHHELGGMPRELLQTAQGLVTTLAYLDGMRAPS